MLGTGVDKVQPAEGELLSVSLANGLTVRTKTIVQAAESAEHNNTTLTRLTAVVDASLSKLFETFTEGAPTPSAAIVAFPSSSVSTAGQVASSTPIYALIHSSETGECPSNQCKLHNFTSSVHYPPCVS